MNGDKEVRRCCLTCERNVGICEEWSWKADSETAKCDRWAEKRARCRAVTGLIAKEEEKRQ